MKTISKRKRAQRPLSGKRNASGLSDYDKLSLSHKEHGPYTTGPELHEVLGLNFFSRDRLDGWRKQFKDHFKGSEQLMLAGIEKAIQCYARSGQEPNKRLLDLKLSLLSTDHTLQEAIRKEQEKLLTLEVHRDMLVRRLTEDPVYPADFLDKYQSKTLEIVDRALSEWSEHIRKNDIELYQEPGDLGVFRGIFNSSYYSGGAAKPDFLSIYAGEVGDVTEFYEPEVLNSNTLSFDTAEKFLTMHENQRRARLDATYGQCRTRILSSFITSPSFKKDQFELLTAASPESNELRLAKIDHEFFIFSIE